MIGCPAYEETSFEPLTAKGRNKALQAGLGARDMEESVWACTLCGYCDAVCPKHVRNVEIVLDLRRRLHGASKLSAPAARDLVLGCTIRERAPWLATSIVRFLQAIGRPAQPESEGCCGSLDVEAGRAAPSRVKAGVVADPICLEQYDADFLGALAVQRLDLLHLKPPFYYFVPHRLLNRDPDRYFPLYDRLRREFGCETNLDLNRLARSTSAGSVQGLSGINARDVRGAVQRLLRNSKADRIVTCSPADYLAFRQHSGRETKFITECLR
jgi:ferredoxin